MDLQANVVTIVPDGAFVLDLAAVPDAVHRSGFRPGVMRLRARGHFVETDDGTGFRIAGWPEPLPVTGPPPPGEGPVLVEAVVLVAPGVLRLSEVEPAEPSDPDG